MASRSMGMEKRPGFVHATGKPQVPSSSTIPSMRPKSTVSTTGSTGGRRNSSTSSKGGSDKGGVVGRVRVAVRLRPRNAQEMVADTDFTDCLELQPELKRLTLRKNNWDSDTYQFDEVLTETSSQKRVYEAVGKPVVEGVCEGYNGTIMAYGQSGTGKSFTLVSLGEEDTSNRGIMVRALEDILKNVNSVDGNVTVSYLQLYMETVQDLLAPKKDNLAIVEDSKTGDVSVPGATQIELKDQQGIMQLLQAGEANRLAANTKLNTESSRSHAILLVSVKKVMKPEIGDTELLNLKESRGSPQFADKRRQASIVRKSKLLIVDLAGSERVGKSGSQGHTLEEAKFINLSLTALGKCINALAENSPHVPARDSKLTRMLQDSFGGTARTSLIVTIGPSQRHRGETASTIAFGQRAMKVENMVKLKEEFDYKSLCRRYEIELDRLKADNEKQCKAGQDAEENLKRRLIVAEEAVGVAEDRHATFLKAREIEEMRLRTEHAEMAYRLKKSERMLLEFQEAAKVAEDRRATALKTREAEEGRLRTEHAHMAVKLKKAEMRLAEVQEAAEDRYAAALQTREEEEGRLKTDHADMVYKLKKAERRLIEFQEDAKAAEDRHATALQMREAEEGRLRTEHADMAVKLKKAEIRLVEVQEAAEAAEYRHAIALQTREAEEGRLRTEHADMAEKLKKSENELKDNIAKSYERKERNSRVENLNLQKDPTDSTIKHEKEVAQEKPKQQLEIAEANRQLARDRAERGRFERDLKSNELLLLQESLQKSHEVQEWKLKLEKESQMKENLEREVRFLKLQLDKVPKRIGENKDGEILILVGKLEEEFKHREILEEEVRDLKEQLMILLLSDDRDESGPKSGKVINKVASERSSKSGRSSEGSHSPSIQKQTSPTRNAVKGQKASISNLFEKVGLLKIWSLLESEDVDIRIHAVQVVANLAKEEANREKIVQVGGLRSLLTLLQNSEDETICCIAVGAIANLAMNETAQELIMAQGGIGLLARTADDALNPQTLKIVAGAIANLCGNEKLLLKLREEGGIRALLGMLRSHHPDVRAQIARGLSNFAKCESKVAAQGCRTARSVLIEDGALPWIVANANNDGSPIRRHTELTICHLAQHEVNSKDLIAAGALWELVRISQECSRDDIRSLAQGILSASQTFQIELKLNAYV